MANTSDRVGAQAWPETEHEPGSGSPQLKPAHDLAVRAVLDVSHHASASSDNHNFFGRLTTTIAELVRARCVLFSRYDSERQQLSPQPEPHGIEPDLLEQMRLRVDPQGDGLAERILFKGLVFGSWVELRAEEARDYAWLLKRLRMSDAVGVAWRAGEERFGILAAFDSLRPQGFTPEDAWVLQMSGLATGLVWQGRQARERLAALEQAKSQFLNLASHELRGPLAVLAGYLSMLEDGSLGELPPQAAEVVPLLSSKRAEMDALVGQILDTARLDDSRLELSRESIDLVPLVRDSIRATRPVADDREPPLVIAPRTSICVLGDRARLATILSNLFENAIKYSPEGGPITCSIDSDQRGFAEISVNDHGLGISAEDMPRLFTRFGRIVTDRNSHIPGTGLGLYLSRELARRHGGDILAQSSADGGTTFTLRLPLAAV